MSSLISLLRFRLFSKPNIVTCWPVAGVLDEPYSQLIPLSSRTGPPVYIGWNRVIVCSLADRYGYSAELA